MTDAPLTVPSVSLPNGMTMPQLGYGVFQIPPDEAEQAVRTALEAGYRSIDTAAAYRNEEGVGRAIAASGVPRPELFVTTKLWNDDQGYDSTLRAFDASAQRLGLDVVDLYLIHWPAPAAGRYLDSWRAMETLVKDGRVRAIGVSNFQPEHIERLVDETDTLPVLNQVELHPYLQQAELRAFHSRHRIVTEAWSPLAQASLLDDPVIGGIAARHGVTPAQVVLRWHVQLGNVAIPKSVTPERILENLAVFGFELDERDLTAIDGLERDGRTGPHPDTFPG